MDSGEDMPINHSQKQLWDSVHRVGKHKAYSNTPTEFATEVASIVPVNATLAELGCGVGMDAAYFAKLGHTVIATDFSEVVVAQDAERYKNIPNLSFQVLDMNQAFPFQNEKLDAVYARLSLHYFPDGVTKNIFQEIHRSLKIGGLLAFMCKSTSDPLYGQGEQIEKDMFIKDGHVRHFFSEDYARSCLGKRFKISKIHTATENLYGKQSSSIKVIATKK